MQTIKKQLWTVAMWVLAFIINTSQTLAARWWDDPSIAPSWSSTSWFKTAFMSTLNYFLWFLGLVTMVIIVYAGVKLVLSQWDEKEYKTAMTTITYAVVGLVLVILSYSIVRLVSEAQIA